MIRPLGSVRYLLALAVKALQSNMFEMIVHADGNVLHEKKVSTAVINNTRHAGNLSVFNNATLHDRKMDMLLTRDTIWTQIRNNLSANGKNPSPSTRMEINAQELFLETAAPMRFMIDGDIWEHVTRVHYQILPGKLTCFTGNSH